MMMMMEMVGQIIWKIGVFLILKMKIVCLQILMMMESVILWNLKVPQDYLDLD